MAEFWGVITTSIDSRYDPAGGGGAPFARRRRHRKVLGNGVATGRSPHSILIDLTHLTWQDQAACDGMDRELFFDDDDAYADQLRPICDSCPVRQACLDHAFTNGEVGFWGGLTTRERRLARERERARTRRATQASG